MTPTAEPVSARPTVPWSVDHLVRLLAQNLVGLIAVCVGAYASSRGDDPQRSIVWANIAVAGLVVAGAANGVWLMRVRRTVSQGRDASLAFTRGSLFAYRPTAAATPSVDDRGSVSAPGTVRFHRPDCEFVRHRVVDHVGIAEIDDCGLRRCEVCQP